MRASPIEFNSQPVRRAPLHIALENACRAIAQTHGLQFRKPAEGVRFHFVETKTKALQDLRALLAHCPVGHHTAFVQSIIAEWENIPKANLRSQFCDIDAIERDAGFIRIHRPSKATVAQLEAAINAIDACTKSLQTGDWAPGFLDVQLRIYAELRCSYVCAKSHAEARTSSNRRGTA
jgi:hypothetical protein